MKKQISSLCATVVVNPYTLLVPNYQIKCYTSRTSSRRKLKYICFECEPGLQQIPKMLALISGLQDEVRDLKVKFAALTDNQASTSVTSNVPAGEDIIHEIYERNKRSRNIIFYGSVESGTSKQEQINLDNVLVQNLLDQTSIQCDGIKPIRLGRFDSTLEQRSRPIRVTLSSSDDVFKIIRKFKTIKNNPQYSHLSASLDRTPRQIAIFKSVKNELTARIAAGETNLKIKYKNGIPTIINVNPEN